MYETDIETRRPLADAAWRKAHTASLQPFNRRRQFVYPQPHVDSSLVVLDRLPREEQSHVDPEDLRRVLQAAFGQRRKILANALSAGLDVPRDYVLQAVRKLDLPEGDAKGLRIAYHAACSLQHGQQIKTHPKDLLKAAGFEVVEPADPHLCCGSAGTYNLMQPEISANLKARKAQTLEAKAPEIIAAGNIGCMIQIGSGTDVPVVHTVELLDWATGGPVPPALSQTGMAPSASALT